jgi:hypothetical protein
VLMLAQMNKNGKATTFPIAEELTKAFDYYFSTVRPQLLGSKQHAYVFCKRTGDAAGDSFDFSNWTQTVGKLLIGRPINTKTFRSAVVTAIHDCGATQSEMNNLAACMGHDPATQRDYYYKVEAQKRAIDSHELVRKAFGMQSQSQFASESAQVKESAQLEEKQPASATTAESAHIVDDGAIVGAAAAAADSEASTCAMDNSTGQN